MRSRHLGALDLLHHIREKRTRVEQGGRGGGGGEGREGKGKRSDNHGRGSFILPTHTADQLIITFSRSNLQQGLLGLQPKGVLSTCWDDRLQCSNCIASYAGRFSAYIAWWSLFNGALHCQKPSECLK